MTSPWPPGFIRPTLDPPVESLTAAAQVAAERDTLDQLADLTVTHGPLTAARMLFGDGRCVI